MKETKLTSLFLCIMALSMLLLFSCTNDLDKVQMAFEGEEIPSVITKNVNVIYSDSGIIRFELQAPERYDYTGKNDNAYSVMPKGIIVKFSDDDEKGVSILTADYAILKDKEGLLITKGHVTIKNASGEELYTNQLTWDDQNKVIYTDELVQIQTKEQQINGEGLWATRDFSKYRILTLDGTVSVNED